MNKTDPPTTFGVFKPVGHTLMAFYTEDQLQSAVVALTALGSAPASMVHFSAGEMATQVDAQLLAASPLASFGYELDLIRVHGDLAKKGLQFFGGGCAHRCFGGAGCRACALHQARYSTTLWALNDRGSHRKGTWPHG